MSWRRTVEWARGRFVLTPQEKKMAAFVAAMFALGLVTMEYRKRNLPAPPPEPVVQAEPRATKAPTPRPRKPKASPAARPGDDFHTPQSSPGAALQLHTSSGGAAVALFQIHAIVRHG
jgi:hypothetical protein